MDTNLYKVIYRQALVGDELETIFLYGFQWKCCLEVFETKILMVFFISSLHGEFENYCHDILLFSSQQNRLQLVVVVVVVRLRLLPRPPRHRSQRKQRTRPTPKMLDRRSRRCLEGLPPRPLQRVERPQPV